MVDAAYRSVCPFKLGEGLSFRYSGDPKHDGPKPHSAAPTDYFASCLCWSAATSGTGWYLASPTRPEYQSPLVHFQAGRVSGFTGHMHVDQERSNLFGASLDKA